MVLVLVVVCCIYSIQMVFKDPMIFIQCSCSVAVAYNSCGITSWTVKRRVQVHVLIQALLQKPVTESERPVTITHSGTWHVPVYILCIKTLTTHIYQLLLTQFGSDLRGWRLIRWHPFFLRVWSVWKKIVIMPACNGQQRHQRFTKTYKNHPKPYHTVHCYHIIYILQ